MSFDRTSRDGFGGTNAARLDSPYADARLDGFGGAPVQSPVQALLQPRAIQLRGTAGDEDTGAVHAAAERGIAGGSGGLPHGDIIQRAFGRHDLGDVQAHTGSAATEAAGAMGAEAYATGNHVVFAGAPGLHTAAHEAAHVVQQRAGVHLKGGVGEVGDRYERHADQVADAVVAGRSAEGLLDELAPQPVGGGTVQRARVVQRGGGKEGENGGEVKDDKKVEVKDDKGQQRDDQPQDPPQRDEGEVGEGGGKQPSELQQRAIEEALREVAVAEQKLNEARQRRGHNERALTAYRDLEVSLAELDKQYADASAKREQVQQEIDRTQDEQARKGLKKQYETLTKEVRDLRSRRSKLREQMQKLKKGLDDEKKLKDLDRRIEDAERTHQTALDRLQRSHTVDEREEKLQKGHAEFELAYGRFKVALEKFRTADPGSPEDYLQAFGELSHALNECTAIKERLGDTDLHGVSQETRVKSGEVGRAMWDSEFQFDRSVEQMDDYSRALARRRFSEDHGNTAKVVKLRFNVFTAGPQLTLDRLFRMHLGHSWISLWFDDETHIPLDLQPGLRGRFEALVGNKEQNKHQNSFGFFPAEQMSFNPFSSFVGGTVQTPDQFSTRETASQTWMITQAQARAVLDYVMAHHDAPYSLYKYNCTTFAAEAVAASGESAPNAFGVGGVAVPNTVFESIAKRQEEGEGTTMVMSDFSTKEKRKHKEGQPQD